MQTECNPDLFGFSHSSRGERWWPRSTAGRSHRMPGGLLLGATDRAIRLVDRFQPLCFRDARTADLIEHQVQTLVAPAGVWHRARLRGFERS